MEKYGGLLPSEVRKLKQLEDENKKLKKLVTDLSLDKMMLQDVLVGIELRYKSYPLIRSLGDVIDKQNDMEKFIQNLMRSADIVDKHGELVSDQDEVQVFTKLLGAFCDDITLGE